MTNIADYANAAPAWRTLIDLDVLGAAEKADWVWKGVGCRPSSTRCLIYLSEGGEDAVSVREFDVASGAFVSGGFVSSKSKQSISWEDADTLLIGRDWGPGTLTASGYPYVVKRWRRGQPLTAATEIWRGQPSDVSANASVYTDAAGHRAVTFTRGLDFFNNETSLLTPRGIEKLALPTKHNIVGLLDGWLILIVQQNWDGTPIKAGSIAALKLDDALAGHIAPQLVYTPGDRQSLDTDYVQVTRSTVLATVNDNVRGRVMAFTPGAKGWTARRMPLPDNATTVLAATNPETDIAYARVTSFLTPSQFFQLDAGAATAHVVKNDPPRFDAAGLVSEQYEAVSKDGTRIPYFLVHAKGAPPAGGWPTVLNAYGGFEVVNSPSYRGTLGKLWLARGGAFALANIRGGGEFGPAWHQAALKTKRQTAYDDFAAVGEDLIKRGFTTSRRLGIMGGSNGGLLTGVSLVQRPDLWQAVNIDVPLLDMIRIGKIAAGASWAGEYGDVSVPAERAFWEQTSPYQQLKPGLKMPTPYITTTTKDDRVGPGHARKFAARMKEYGLPYLFWEDTIGGHGVANLKQAARTTALDYVYFSQMLMGEGTGK